MKEKSRSVFVWLVRLALAGVFAYAGIVKILNVPLFVEQVRAYDLLGDPWSSLVALYLPWLEVFVALGLLLPLRRGAALLVALLSLAFMGGIASAWARGLDIACGCFAETGTSNYPLHLAFNLALLAGAVVVLAAGRGDRGGAAGAA